MAVHGRAEATPFFERLCPAMTKSEWKASAPKLARQHFFQDLTADRLVGQRRRVPPPAVVLHLLRGCDEAILHFGEIGIAEVQAEDEPSRTGPAQREALGAQVILEHP